MSDSKMADSVMSVVTDVTVLPIPKHYNIFNKNTKVFFTCFLPGKTSHDSRHQAVSFIFNLKTISSVSSVSLLKVLGSAGGAAGGPAPP